MTRLRSLQNAEDAVDDTTCAWTGRINLSSGSMTDRLDASAFLQALPIPSGKADTTVSHDYDRTRFFFSQTDEARVLRNTYVKSVARLSESISQHLAHTFRNVESACWAAHCRSG